MNVSWAEVTGASRATAYQVFESLSNAYGSGVLIAVVPANPAGTTNSFLRVGLLDTNPRFYWVVPLTVLGIPGGASAIKRASATSVPLTAGASIDNLSFGRLASVFADMVVNGGQLDLSSLDVLNKGESILKQLSVFGSQSVASGTPLLVPDSIIGINTGTAPVGLSLALNPNWVVKQGVFQAGNGDVSSIAGGADFRASAYFKGSGIGADQKVTVVVSQPDAVSNNGLGPAARMDTALETYYGCNAHGQAGTLELVKVVNGVTTSLGTAAYTSKVLDQISITCVGTTISAIVNGNALIVVTDAAIASGNPGIHSVQSDNTSVHISKFTAVDINTNTTVSDVFTGRNKGGKSVLLFGFLIVNTAAATVNVTVQIKRDGGNLTVNPYNFSLPASTNGLAVPFVYVDTGLQTGGGGGFAPGPLAPGVHQYQLQLATGAGTITLTDGYFFAVTLPG